MLSLKAQVGNVYSLLQIKKLEREAGEGQQRAEDGDGKSRIRGHERERTDTGDQRAPDRKTGKKTATGR